MTNLRPLAAAAAAFSALALTAPAAEPPNLMIILADDLGYSDLGCYGGEIATPNLDALAAGGLRFTQFYNTGRCWPTRAALLTGFYAQQVRRDALPGVPKTGGRGTRPDWAPLLPAMLKPAGFRSYHSGKWHLDGMPVEGGFDRSYYLADQGRFFSPQRHFEDDAKLPAVERGTGFYGTEAIAGHAVRCLQDHAAHHAGAPFFHFVAFTAPHFPLHAEPGDIAKYAGKYEAGWEAVRAARWARQQESGIGGNALSAPERDLGPPYHFPDALEKLGAGEVNRPLPWGDLTAGQQRFQAQKMAIHAAMIDRMDREIGRIIAQLREMGALENTLIVFLSDNGASAEIMVRDDGHDPAAPPGSADSYLCLGPGWSTCANTPFRRHKTWNHEGGIATPFIAHWPAGIKARGELRAFPAHVIDLVPTALALAGAAREHSDAPAAPGTSLLPAFSDDLPPREAPLWWSHEGNAALRLGDWKITRAKGDPWALYDLGKDRAEQRDLSHANPDRAEAMAAQWAAMEAEFVRLAKGE